MKSNTASIAKNRLKAVIATAHQPEPEDLAEQTEIPFDMIAYQSYYRSQVVSEPPY